MLGSSFSSFDTVDIMVADGLSSLLLSEQSSLHEPPSESINELTSSSPCLSSSFSSSVPVHESRRNIGTRDIKPFHHSTEASFVSSVEAMPDKVSSARVTVISPTSERQKEKDGKAVEDEYLPDLTSDLDHFVAHPTGSPSPSSVSTAPSPLLSSSFTTTPLLLEGVSPVQRNINSTNRRGECCICLARAIYTCPACEKGVCSLACSRTHKEASFPSCTGLPDPTAKILLKDYTAVQCSRDIRFLEDCRQVIGSIERRTLPGDHRSAHGSDSSTGLQSHALGDGGMLKKREEVAFSSSVGPSNHADAVISSFLHERASPPEQPQNRRFLSPSVELQKAALRRGIYCIILSPGMARRVANTSRCLPDSRIIWRCEFNFYKKEKVAFHLCIDESVETLRLEEILLNCWNMSKENMRSEHCGTNRKIEESEEGKSDCLPFAPSDPANLPLASPFSPVCASSTQQSEDREQKVDQARDNSSQRVDAVAHESFVLDGSSFPQVPFMSAKKPCTSAFSAFTSSEEEREMNDDDWEDWSKIFSKMTKETAQNAGKGNSDVDSSSFVILYKLPRIGVQPQCFCQLMCDEKLLEALQRVKVVTEFPTFEVVRVEDLHFFPLTSEEEFSAWKAVVSSRLLKKPMDKSGRMDGKKGRKNKPIGKGEENHHLDRSSPPGHRRFPASKRGRGAGGSSQSCSKKRFQQET